MFNNAEFLRNVRVQLTPRRLMFTSGLTLGLIIISELLIWTATAKTEYSSLDYDRWAEFGMASFNLLFFAQIILLTAMAPSVVGGSIIQERLRNTLIFQQMTLLSSHEVLLGKMFGSTIVYYVLAALIMPFAFLGGLIARIPIDSLVGIYLVLLVGALSWQAVSLFISSSIVNAQEAAGRNLAGLSYSIGGLAVFFMMVFFNIFWRNNWEMQESTTYFFSSPILALTFAVMVMSFIGIWAYVGAVRAFKDLQLIKLSPRTVWYFFIALEVLLVGWFWGGTLSSEGYASASQEYFKRNVGALFVAYLFINWIFLAALAGISVISRNQFREWWSGSLDAVSLLKRLEIKNSIINYPISIAIVLVGAVALWGSMYVGLPDRESLLLPFSSLIAMMVAFAVTMLSMASFIQFCAMYRFRVANRAGLVLWVMIMVIAAIATGVLGPESVPGFFNPIVFSVLLIEESDKALSTISIGLLIEILFALLSIGMMYWKWRRTRDEMLKDKD